MDRFWNKVNKTENCWLWTKSLTAGGYGRFSVSGLGILAHRWAYEDARGPIPAGLELDHLCRIPACVNPDHLEAVTHTENVRRGNGGRRPAEHCPRQHPYSPENTYIRPDGKGRGCRKCRTQWRTNAQ